MSTDLGPYKLLRRIASGGMGEVYLAVLKRDGGFSKTVALKTLLPSLSKQTDLAQRFEQEAACAAVLNHPNIVQVFDHGKAGEISYLTMEFVEGPPLEELLANMGSKRVPVEVAAEIGVQLCRALGHAHERTDLQGHPVGIIHGDVSPSNILLSKDGTVKLADFGLSRIAMNSQGDGTICGKLSYMSPEQAQAQALRPASDVFSLGLVLFELFSGKKAFPLSGSPSQSIERIKNGEREALSKAAEGKIADEICQVIEKALDTDPEQRYERISDLAKELTAAVTPCGPELLAEFISEHAPTQHVSNTVIPEPTQLAEAPLRPEIDSDPRLGRHWLAAILLILSVAWAAGFGWWFFHTPISAKPSPPVSKLPRPPKNLSLSIVTSEPKPEKAPGTKSEQTEPKPSTKVHAENKSKAHGSSTATATKARHEIAAKTSKIETESKAQFKNATKGTARMLIELPEGTSGTIDHVYIKGGKIRIEPRKDHLLELKSELKNSPTVRLRLKPATSEGTWNLTISSRPWMRILLNGKPSGQTPKTGLLIPRQGGRLVLSRGEASMRLRFSPMTDRQE